MPTLDIDQLIKLLTDEADKAGSQVALAKRLNVSAPYLSDVLNRRRDPGEAILEPLGLRRKAKRPSWRATRQPS